MAERLYDLECMVQGRKAVASFGKPELSDELVAIFSHFATDVKRVPHRPDRTDGLDRVDQGLVAGWDLFWL